MASPKAGEVVPPEKVDDAGTLSVLCIYGDPTAPPATIVQVQIFRDPAKHGDAAADVKESLTYLRAMNTPMAELPGFEETATAVAASGTVQVFAVSRNASVEAMIGVGPKVMTQAELEPYLGDAALTLREVLANLRPA